jgi:hypothetical protein
MGTQPAPSRPLVVGVDPGPDEPNADPSIDDDGVDADALAAAYLALGHVDGASSFVVSRRPALSS